MRSAARRHSPVVVHVGRSPARAYVQIVGALVLGLGLAAGVGLDPGFVFALYTVGLGSLLLCLGALLPDDPESRAELHDRSCPPPS
jgi:hypothetical protein